MSHRKVFPIFKMFVRHDGLKVPVFEEVICSSVELLEEQRLALCFL